MTFRQFWADPYQSRHRTRIGTVAGDQVTLESTIFFALSGGQESDTGTIASTPVLAARKDGSEITYTLPDQHGLVSGQEVEVVIDWPRRYRLMRLHFAAEIVLELFIRVLPGVERIGSHIAQDKSRIDFAWPENISPLLPEIVAQANAIVAADFEIRTGFDDEPNQRRFWEIDGFSRVSCGGTHVRRTGEVGPIRLKRNNIGKGKERVEIYLIS